MGDSDEKAAFLADFLKNMRVGATGNNAAPAVVIPSAPAGVPPPGAFNVPESIPGFSLPSTQPSAATLGGMAIGTPGIPAKAQQVVLSSAPSGFSLANIFAQSSPRINPATSVEQAVPLPAALGGPFAAALGGLSQQQSAASGTTQTGDEAEIAIWNNQTDPLLQVIKTSADFAFTTNQTCLAFMIPSNVANIQINPAYTKCTIYKNYDCYAISAERMSETGWNKTPKTFEFKMANLQGIKIL